MNLKKFTPFISCALVILILSSCASRKAQLKTHCIETSIFTHSKQDNLAKESKQIIAYAKRFMGVKYKYGGKGPQVFDCSGFTRYVFKHFGYLLPHSSRMQSRTGRKVSVKRARPGDLVFFSGRRTGNKVGHVGIIIACRSGSFRFIHAPYKGVRIDEYPRNSYYRKHFIMIRRIIK